MKSILIIEDNMEIAELERDFLEADGIESVIETDGTKGLERALADDFDLILLDIMLPGTDGFHICRRIREEKEVPILMVSAKREDMDKIRGLGLGADDYIIKPFSPTELVARVKAHIQRYERLTGKSRPETGNGEVLTSGDLEIYVDKHRVYVKGREISLTNREFELLVFLAKHPAWYSAATASLSGSGASTPKAIRQRSWSISTASVKRSNPIRPSRCTSKRSGAPAIVLKTPDLYFASRRKISCPTVTPAAEA